MNRPFNLVRNHEAVIASMGVWPTIHDAEVISFRCDRSGPFIEFDIHAGTSPRIAWTTRDTSFEPPLRWSQ